MSSDSAGSVNIKPLTDDGMFVGVFVVSRCLLVVVVVVPLHLLLLLLCLPSLLVAVQLAMNHDCVYAINCYCSIDTVRDRVALIYQFARPTTHRILS